MRPSAAAPSPPQLALVHVPAAWQRFSVLGFQDAYAGLRTVSAFAAPFLKPPSTHSIGASAPFWLGTAAALPKQ